MWPDMVEFRSVSSEIRRRKMKEEKYKSANMYVGRPNYLVIDYLISYGLLQRLLSNGPADWRRFGDTKYGDRHLLRNLRIGIWDSYTSATHPSPSTTTALYPAFSNASRLPEKHRTSINTITWRNCGGVVATMTELEMRGIPTRIIIPRYFNRRYRLRYKSLKLKTSLYSAIKSEDSTSTQTQKYMIVKKFRWYVIHNSVQFVR